VATRIPFEQAKKEEERITLTVFPKKAVLPLGVVDVLVLQRGADLGEGEGTDTTDRENINNGITARNSKIKLSHSIFFFENEDHEACPSCMRSLLTTRVSHGRPTPCIPFTKKQKSSILSREYCTMHTPIPFLQPFPPSVKIRLQEQGRCLYDQRDRPWTLIDLDGGHGDGVDLEHSVRVGGHAVNAAIT
jgi:hypothetical protein